MLLHFLTLFVSVKLILGQNPTPCPDVFSYEPFKQGNDRWFGEIKYSAPENITGIYLHITIDRPVDILGNWFGQVTTSDNTVFAIRNRDYKLQPADLLKVRLFVKFNLAQPIPSLVAIKLNGKAICVAQNNEISTPPSPQLELEEVTESNNNETTEIINLKLPVSNSPVKIEASLSLDENNDAESESYPGDFALLQLAQARISPGSKSYQCGTVTANNTLGRLKEWETFPGQWPWHAALYRSKDTNLVYLCGGTLVTDRHVIAPAHCVTGFHTKHVTQPNNFLISIGKYNLNRFGPSIQNSIVANIVIHPNYNYSFYINDIAVLQLAKPVNVTDFVRPACLWEGDLNITGKEGTIVGWGVDENKKLVKTEMTILPIKDCVFSKSIPDGIYCAEFKNGISACRVRSISGMVVPKGGSTSTTWQIRGLNILYEVRAPCEDIRYIIFTDVAKYTPWIKEVINKL